MELIEILSLIAVALMIVVLVLLIMNLKKPKNQYNDLLDQLVRFEKNIDGHLTSKLMQLNHEVSQQLLSMNDLSGKNVADFRVKVNEQLGLFQEKISDRFNHEFKVLNSSFQEQMSNINVKVEARLNQGFKDTNETFINIAKRVEVIDQAQKQIRSLSEEMVSLQNILSNNQSRGAFGEYQLNQLLYSVYGDNTKLYQTQYSIKSDNGTVRADAVVFMPKPNDMIVIDSKFPYTTYAQLFGEKTIDKELENQLITQFGREVKKHITDISSKYILPPITTDYALMFVPSDGILSLLHSKLTQVIDYAREKNVTIVSPTTIIPLLSSFKAFVIDYERNKNIEKIHQELNKLGRDFRIFGSEWSKLSRSIQTVKKDTDQLDTRVEKMNSKFDSIKEVTLFGDDEERVEKHDE